MGLFSSILGELRIKTDFKLNNLEDDDTEDKERIVTWEIEPIMSGHLRTCKGFWKKQSCACDKVKQYDLVKDSMKDLLDFIETAGIKKYVKVAVKVDPHGHTRVFMRCSRYFAQLVKNSDSVRKITLCNNLELVRQCV
jgi:hypothetical protein